MHSVGVVIAAGGRGRRMGGSVPKQFLKLGDRTILEATVAQFDGHPRVNEIVIVTPRAYVEHTAMLLAKSRAEKVTMVVAGGKERQESVWRGLQGLSASTDIVLVQDAVRPFVSRELISSVIRATERYGAAVPGIVPRDTIAQEGRRGFYGPTLSRESLRAIQTPQGFLFASLWRAHHAARKAGFLGTDDASLLQRLHIPVRMVDGTVENLKITTYSDLLSARTTLI